MLQEHFFTAHPILLVIVIAWLVSIWWFVKAIHEAPMYYTSDEEPNVYDNQDFIQ